MPIEFCVIFTHWNRVHGLCDYSTSGFCREQRNVKCNFCDESRTESWIYFFFILHGISIVAITQQLNIEIMCSENAARTHRTHRINTFFIQFKIEWISISGAHLAPNHWVDQTFLVRVSETTKPFPPAISIDRSIANKRKIWLDVLVSDVCEFVWKWCV